MAQTDRIGLDYLTLLGEAPPHFIRTAAAAGARHVGLFLVNWVDPFERGPFSLIDDKALRRETIAIARDLGVSIAMADGFNIYPDRPVDEHRPAFDAIAEMGCTMVNMLSFEPDWDRMLDKMAPLAGLAADYGVTLLAEVCPRHPYPISSVARGIEAIAQIGQPHVKLLIDTMHVTRSGEAMALAQVDPALIGYVQLCDGAAVVEDSDTYRYQALYERAIPGAGEMRLAEIIAQLPRDVIVSGEVPQRGRKAAGVSDLDHATEVVTGIEAVLRAAAPAAQAASRSTDRKSVV